MLLTTVSNLGGHRFDVIGLVTGTFFEAKSAVKEMATGPKSIVGGELVGYTEVLREARKIAADRMIDEAVAMNADAIIGVEFSTAPFSLGVEILVTGTAVRFV